MPLPWKKAKRARISQLVADHVHSPQRGGSLVVETGFPTSIVDLFVKNRDRLRKPSNIRPVEPGHPMAQPPLPSPKPPLPSPTSAAVSPISTPSISFSESRNTDVYSSRRIANDIVVGSVDKPSAVEVADSNGVFAAVLKISLVVVFVLGTKHVAIGIATSALLLIFLECFGKHVHRLLKPCRNQHKSLHALIRRVLCFLGINSDNLGCKGEKVEKMRVLKAPTERKSGGSDCSFWVERREMDSQTEQIQIVKLNSELVAAIEDIVNDEFEMHDCDRRWRCEELDTDNSLTDKEEDYTGDIFESNPRPSHRASIKSKLKKLVTKKFRSSLKKKRPDLKSEESNSAGEDREEICTEQTQEEDGEAPSISSSLGRCDDQDMDVIYFPGEVLQPATEEIVAEEEVTKRNSGYLTLFLIVLAGLLGGRILALALILLWCLMLKSAGKMLGGSTEGAHAQDCCQNNS